MALLDTFKSKNVLMGLAIGVGAAVLAPVVVPIVAAAAKPIAKAAIKGGITAYRKGREAIAEVKEVAEDVVAEAKAEASGMQQEEEMVNPPGEGGK